MSERAAAEPKAVATSEPEREPVPIVVEFGKKRRKQIKKLCRGEGKLMDRAMAVVAELKSAGTVSELAQPVIFVVEKKSKAQKGWPLR